MPFLRTKLDQAVVASIAAMLALNVVVLSEQLQARPAPAMAATHELVTLA